MTAEHLIRWITFKNWLTKLVYPARLTYWQMKGILGHWFNWKHHFRHTPVQVLEDLILMGAQADSDAPDRVLTHAVMTAAYDEAVTRVHTTHMQQRNSIHEAMYTSLVMSQERWDRLRGELAAVDVSWQASQKRLHLIYGGKKDSQ
jgi:hypothetical protein